MEELPVFKQKAEAIFVLDHVKRINRVWMLGKLEGFLQNMMVLYVLFLSPYNRIEINNKPLSNDYAQSSDCIFF